MLVSKVDQRVFRWFGHLERIDEYNVAKWVLMAEVDCVHGVEVMLIKPFLWCEGSHGQQKDDGGGCVIICKRWEGPGCICR